MDIWQKLFFISASLITLLKLGSILITLGLVTYLGWQFYKYLNTNSMEVQSN